MDGGAERMTLRAVHSNRTEALFRALIAALAPPDPFAPQTIVVGSHMMARWLTREIALARGIFAGIHITTFDQFVEETWAGVHSNPELLALDRDQLAAAIASVLADNRFVTTLPPVAAYLGAASGTGDAAGPRRVQLANQLARLAWMYAMTRPDWMADFIAGRPGRELQTDLTARWQAAIFGEAMARLGDRKAAPIPMLPWLRRHAGLTPPRIDPIHVFGISYFQRAQLEALTDLGTTSDVAVYLLNPCSELWDDVSGRSGAHRNDEPLLLPLWGRALKDTLAALVERTGGDIEDAFERGPATTAHAALLADTAARTAPSQCAPLPAGIQILACANPRRELEAIAATIRSLLDSDGSAGARSTPDQGVRSVIDSDGSAGARSTPDSDIQSPLRANQIVVWIASDVETYLALAPSAFEAVGVPCHLIDAPIDDRGRIGEAVLALLELPTSAMTRSDLLRVMTHPALLANHPHVDVADWVRWTERLGIVHGRDAAAHSGTYLADHPDKFHWDQGVRRLALGAFMVGAERGAAHIADIDVLPEEVRPDQQASAATYALLVRSLSADAAWLAHHEAPLVEWAEIFVAVIDSYLSVPSARDARTEDRTDSSRDIDRVRSLLAGIARVDIDGRRMGFREARQHAVSRLLAARQDRGEPLAYGVTIAPLRTHRAIPFEIACVVGLDDSQFPASQHVSPLDVRASAPARPGDVSARDRDRHAFFEVVLGARRALYLSYVAVEPTSGAPVAPSSVVSELADALVPYIGAGSSREALDRITIRHSLHRFGAGGETAPPAVARERWAVRVRDAITHWLRARDVPVPDADGMLALLAHPSLAALRRELGMADRPAATPSIAAAVGLRTISLAQVRSFLESPVQAWAQVVLDLDEIPDEAALDHSDEPFHLDRPTRAVLLRNVFAAFLRDPQMTLEQHYDAIAHEYALRSQFPVGVFGAAARTADLRTMHQWRDELGPIAVGAATRIAFGRASSAIARRSTAPVELMPAIDLRLAPERAVRIVGTTEILVRGGDRALSIIPVLSSVDGKSRYHLRGALDHLALAAAGLAANGHDHIVLDPDGGVKRVSHSPWSQADAHDYLAALTRELLDAPHGYLLPFDLSVRALSSTPRSGVTFGDSTEGLGFGPIERRDGLAIPSDVQEIARRRLGPIVARMVGDHTFEAP